MRKISRSEAEMPFLEHLEELRWRIIWSVIAAVAGIAVGVFGTALQPMITAENYFGFVFSMVLSFGVAFELPVVILLLAAAGLVTPQFLSRYRRHAVVLIVVLSAFLTPGDFIWSTLALSVPLYALYEVSVLAAFVMWRRRDADVGAVMVLLAPLIAMRALTRTATGGRQQRHLGTV